jgi:hypothetical protein
MKLAYNFMSLTQEDSHVATLKIMVEHISII